jgi:hypothetical protein
MVNEFVREKVEKVLDLMEGQSINFEYNLIGTKHKPHFEYLSFLGYVQDDMLYLGDSNMQDGIPLDEVTGINVSEVDMSLSVNIDFVNGNKLVFYKN